MAEREIVVNLRLTEGNTREQFRAISAALIDVKQEVRDTNKALRDNAKEIKALDAAYKAGEVTAEQYAVAQQRLTVQREQLKGQAANLAASEAALSAQYREAKNEVGGLTEAQLRFRDKMAQASLEAIQQSGILGQLGVRSEFLRSEIDRLNAEYQQGKITQEQYAASQAKITVELNKVQAEIGQTNAKVDLLTKEFQQGKITADQFRAGISDIGKGFDGIGGAINKGVADLKSFALGFVGVIAVAQGAIAAIRSIAGTIADFDQQLANIRALGQEYAASINEIADAAVKLGPKLGVAPVEALKGFEALAKAGLTTQQILGGGLEAALTLAAAGEVSVGEAAETAAAALTQFNLQGEDAGLIADLLAKGANIAQGNVSDFAAALNQSGLVASQFGLSIEETVGGLTAFAQAGLIGSDAGTSFRAALLRLQNPTKESQALLDQYGITLTNANGEFLSLAEIAGQLQTQLGGLTEAQRGATLATIFGQDAIRVANILYREGAQGINNYTKEVNDAGFANGVAQTKLDSLQGSVRQLGAAWDRFVLSVESGDGVLGKAIRGTIDLVRDLVDALADLGGKGPLSEAIAKAEGEIKNFQGVGRNLRQGTRDFAREFLQLQGELERQQALQAQNIRQNREKAAIFNGEEIDRIQKAIEAKKKEQIAYLQALQAKNQEKAATDGIAASSEREAQATETVAQARQRLNTELEAAKARKDALNASDIAGVRAAQAEVTAIENRIKALDGEGKATGNVAGSVAALNEQIAQLKAAQQQATSSEQFATYQTQIDALTQSVDLLTGKLSQDLLDAAASIPQVQSTIDTLVPANRTAPLTPAAQATPDSPEQALKAQAEELFASLDTLEEFYVARDLLAQFYSDRDLARKEAELASDQAINEAKLQGAQLLAQGLASLADEGSALAKVAFGLQKALAIAEVITNLNRQLQAIRTSTAIASISAAPAGIGAVAAVEATGAARAVRAKIEAGLSIAQIVAQSLSGFAQGGYISGERVRPSHGVPIRRSNGDNRLVTVKTGEVVMNEEQQEELRRRAGSSIFRELGIPGFATGGTITRGTALVNASLPISLGNVANRVLQVQTNEANQALAERPIFVRVEEINKLQGRVAQVTELSRA